MSTFPTIPPGMGWPFVDATTGEFQSAAVNAHLNAKIDQATRIALDRAIPASDLGGTLIPPGALVHMNTAHAAWFTANSTIGDRFRLDVPTRFASVSISASAHAADMQVGIYALALVGSTWQARLVQVSELLTGVADNPTIPFEDIVTLPPGEYAVVVWCSNTTKQFNHVLSTANQRFSLGAVSYNSATGLVYDLSGASAAPSGRTVGLALNRDASPTLGTITTFGDSITAANDWWWMAMTMRGYTGTVSSRGVGGNTTAQMRARIDDVIGDDPAIVTMMGGTNSLAGGVSAASVIDDLDYMLTRILDDTDARVILGEITPRTYVGGDTDADAAIATVNAWLAGKTNNRVQLARWHDILTTDGTAPDTDYFSDHVHPNDRGERIMAAVLAPLI